ncbi:MAG: riboflavin synthase [Alphaproteobacteria bacterium]|nr:riboflavin synthase [Alphaproteobacteria bacterium]
MFSGIIKEIGRVDNIIKTDGKITLEVAAPLLLKDAVIDDSIAVNGVCLTVVHLSANTATFEILPETIARTSLGDLVIGGEVNVESSITLQDKIGGHMVQGHVDDVVIIKSIQANGAALDITFTGNSAYTDMLVEKAYIGLDGMSLTITAVEENTFSVMIIPHTFNNTVVKNWQVNTKVNMEVDIINKSIYKYIKALEKK